jgi:hypothetical protein
MSALLPVPPEFDDRTLELVEQFYTNQSGPWQLPDHLLQSPAVMAYTTILQAVPFRDCKQDHIWGETRYTTKREFLCRDRPRLLAILAIAWYEDLEIARYTETTPQATQTLTLEALLHIRAMCDFFVRLRDERDLSDAAQEQTAYLHADTLREAFTVVQRVAMALTPEDYASLHRPRLYSLFARMRAAFDAYGPTDKRFNQAAKDYAIASILIHCGREPGTPSSVVARLRAREKRASTPAQD